MATIGFDTPDPTLGVPGATKVGKRKVSFRDRAAARKWFALVDAQRRLGQLRKKVKKAKESAARFRRQAKDTSDAARKRALSRTAQRADQRAARAQKVVDLVKAQLDKAKAAAKGCNVADTRKFSQLAREAAAAGVDTGGAGLGLPVPGADENSIGVDGPRGKGRVRAGDQRKHAALAAALPKIWAAETALQELQVELEFLDEDLRQAEARLAALEGRLEKAKANLAKLNELDPSSVEGVVELEAARAAVKKLAASLRKLRKAIDKAKKGLEAKRQKLAERIQQLRKALDAAYRKLASMYAEALACKSRKTKELGKEIGKLVGALPKKANKLLRGAGGGGNGGDGGGNGAGEEEGEDGEDGDGAGKRGKLQQALEDAEKKADKADKETDPGKIDKIREAESAYFAGFYTAVLANFKKKKGKASISVDEFLTFQGTTYKKVVTFKCKIKRGETVEEVTVNLSLRWSFGPAPKPVSEKPEGQKGEDGKFEIETKGGTVKDGVLDLEIDARVILFFVGKFDHRAADKALFYHELLHGQLWLDFVKTARGQKKLCEFLQAGGGTLPTPGDKRQHKKIDPAQDKFQKKIAPGEKKAAEKAKKDYRSSR